MFMTNSSASCFYLLHHFSEWCSFCLLCRWAFAGTFVFWLLCLTSCPPLCLVPAYAVRQMCPIHLSLCCHTVSKMFLEGFFSLFSYIHNFLPMRDPRSIHGFEIFCSQFTHICLLFSSVKRLWSLFVSETSINSVDTLIIIAVNLLQLSWNFRGGPNWRNASRVRHIPRLSRLHFPWSRSA